MFIRRLGLVSTALALTVVLAACGSDQSATPSAGTSPGLTEGTQLTVITHDSFALSEDAVASFEEKTGYEVEFVAPGDAGTVVNQLVLTKDSPLGDVVFGIDNTFAGRAISQGILSPLPLRAAAGGRSRVGGGRVRLADADRLRRRLRERPRPVVPGQRAERARDPRRPGPARVRRPAGGREPGVILPGAGVPGRDRGGQG